MPDENRAATSCLPKRHVPLLSPDVYKRQGVGTVIGAVVGAFVMGILNNGMFLVGLSTDLQKVVKGLVLLGAVTFNVLSNKKKN